LRQVAERCKIQLYQIELVFPTVAGSRDLIFPSHARTNPIAANQSAPTRTANLTPTLPNTQSMLPTARIKILTVRINYTNTRVPLHRDKNHLSIRHLRSLKQ
jgi:hypothetical protein